jgi:hypothetical protein
MIGHQSPQSKFLEHLHAYRFVSPRTRPSQVLQMLANASKLSTKVVGFGEGKWGEIIIQATSTIPEQGQVVQVRSIPCASGCRLHGAILEFGPSSFASNAPALARRTSLTTDRMYPNRYFSI